jgi:hypothetical protein
MEETVICGTRGGFAIIGFTPCHCDGDARGFGEALFSVAGCENCDESVSGVGVDTRTLFNAGIRDIL